MSSVTSMQECVFPPLMLGKLFSGRLGCPSEKSDYRIQGFPKPGPVGLTVLATHCHCELVACEETRPGVRLEIRGHPLPQVSFQQVPLVTETAHTLMSCSVGLPVTWTLGPRSAGSGADVVGDVPSIAALRTCEGDSIDGPRNEVSRFTRWPAGCVSQDRLLR